MNNNNDKPIANPNADSKYFCPSCKAEMVKISKETNFFHYFKCRHCNKTFRERKTLNAEETIFLIGAQLQKIKEAIYCIISIITIWFIISFIYYFIIR